MPYIPIGSLAKLGGLVRRSRDDEDESWLDDADRLLGDLSPKVRTPAPPTTAAVQRTPPPEPVVPDGDDDEAESWIAQADKLLGRPPEAPPAIPAPPSLPAHTQVTPLQTTSPQGMARPGASIDLPKDINLPYEGPQTYTADARGAKDINLPVDEEPAFQQWYARYAKTLKLNPNPDDPRHFYDYRAAFRAGATPDARGHWPSEFKLAGHPNLVVDGRDTRTGTLAPVGPVAPGQEASSIQTQYQTRLGGMQRQVDALTREHDRVRTDFDTRVREHTAEVHAFEAQARQNQTQQDALKTRVQAWIDAGRPEAGAAELEAEGARLHGVADGLKSRAELLTRSQPNPAPVNALVGRIKTLHASLQATAAEADAAAAQARAPKTSALDAIGPQATVEQLGYHEQPVEPTPQPRAPFSDIKTLPFAIGNYTGQKLKALYQQVAADPWGSLTRVLGAPETDTPSAPPPSRPAASTASPGGLAALVYALRGPGAAEEKTGDVTAPEGANPATVATFFSVVQRLSQAPKPAANQHTPEPIVSPGTLYALASGSWFQQAVLNGVAAADHALKTTGEVGNGEVIRAAVAKAIPPDVAQAVREEALNAGVVAVTTAMTVPEMVVGSADLAAGTGGEIGKFAEDRLKFRPAEARRFLEDYYSPRQKAAFDAVAHAKGYVDKGIAAMTHPSTVIISAVQSLPAMFLSELTIGRALAAEGIATGWAGAAAEGVTSAGQTYEQIRQQTPGGRLSPEQAHLMTLSGTGTTLMGRFGNALATKLGVADVDTMLIAAAGNTAARHGLVKAVAYGATSEILEEFGQSFPEQILQNKAEGRPWDEGLDDNVVMSVLTAAVLGGGGNALTHETPPHVREKTAPKTRRFARAADTDATSFGPERAGPGHEFTPDLPPEIVAADKLLDAHGRELGGVAGPERVIPPAVSAPDAESREPGALSPEPVAQPFPQPGAEENNAVTDKPATIASLSPATGPVPQPDPRDTTQYTKPDLPGLFVGTRVEHAPTGHQGTVLEWFEGPPQSGRTAWRVQWDTGETTVTSDAINLKFLPGEAAPAAPPMTTGVPPASRPAQSQSQIPDKDYGAMTSDELAAEMDRQFAEEDAPHTESTPESHQSPPTEGPHWHPDSTYAQVNPEDHDPQQVLDLVKEEQAGRLYAIARLKDAIATTTAKGHNKKLERLKKDLHDTQMNYLGTWEEIEHNMLGVDWDATRAAVEADAQQALRGETAETGATPPASRPAQSQTGETPKASSYWMNESEIAEAVDRFTDHPVLGPAARFLEAFKEQVNQHSDGWPYWKQPAHAAAQLMGLVHGHLRAGMGAYPHLAEPTAADVQRALAPIKAFMTRKGTAAGLTLPTLELPTAVTSKPAQKTETPAPAPARAIEEDSRPEDTEELQAGDELPQNIRDWPDEALEAAILRAEGDVQRTRDAKRGANDRGAEDVHNQAVANLNYLKDAQRRREQFAPLAPGERLDVLGYESRYFPGLEGDRARVKELTKLGKTKKKGLKKADAKALADLKDRVGEKEQRAAFFHRIDQFFAGHWEDLPSDNLRGMSDEDLDRLRMRTESLARLEGRATALYAYDDPLLDAIAAEHMRRYDESTPDEIRRPTSKPARRANADPAIIEHDGQTYVVGGGSMTVGDKVSVTAFRVVPRAEYTGPVAAMTEDEYDARMGDLGGGWRYNGRGLGEWLRRSDEAILARAEREAETDRIRGRKTGVIYTIGGKEWVATGERVRVVSTIPAGEQPKTTAARPSSESQPAQPAAATPPIDTGAMDAPYSTAALRAAFNLTDEQADAVHALVEGMGLDTARLRVVKGGTPGEGSLTQVERLTPNVLYQWGTVKGDDLLARINDLRRAVDAGYAQHTPAATIAGLEQQLAALEEEAEHRADALLEYDRDNEDEIGALSLEEQLAHLYHERHKETGYKHVQTDQALVDAIRSAIDESAWIGTNGANTLRPDVTDAQLVDAAKDAYDTAVARRDRLKRGRQTNEALRRWLDLHVDGPTTLYQDPSSEPFYSRLRRAVEQAKQEKATGQQWKGTILNAKGGINRDEYTFAHVEDLDDGTTYTKQDVLDYLAANAITISPVTLREHLPADDDYTRLVHQIQDEGYDVEGDPIDPETQDQWLTRHGDIVEDDDETVPTRVRRMLDQINGLNMVDGRAQYGAYQSPGATEDHSYQEVLLTVPPRPRTDDRAPLLEEARSIGNEWAQNTYWMTPERARTDPAEFQRRYDRNATIEKRQDAIQQALRALADRTWEDGHDGYAGVKNPLVRLRFNVREVPGATPKRAMYLEEVQPPSKREFAKMPVLFQKHWREVAFKWALRYAAENGLDVVAWTPGKVQADRYSLETQVKRITWSTPEPDSGTHLGGYERIVVVEPKGSASFSFSLDRDYHVAFADHGRLNGKALDDIVGKEVADRIQNAPHGELAGEGLKIGGVGLTRLYDVDYPNVVNKIPAVKRAGVRVEPLALGTDYGPKTFGIITVSNWLPASPSTILDAFRTHGLDALDRIGIVDEDEEDESVQSLDYVFGAGLIDYVAARVDDGADAWDAVQDYLYNNDHDPKEFWVLGEDAPRVPALAITPELRAAVLGGQPLFQGPKGATEFAADGKAIIRGLQAADLSTAVHEIAHVARRQLLNRNVPANLRQGITDDDIDTIEYWATGSIRGPWDVQAEETFARGFERYISTGFAPTTTLQRIFGKLRDWFSQIYQQVRGSDIDVAITPAVREVFDKLVSRAERNEDGTDVWHESETVSAFEYLAENKGAKEDPHEYHGNLLDAALEAFDAYPSYLRAISDERLGRVADAYRDLQSADAITSLREKSDYTDDEINVVRERAARAAQLVGQEERRRAGQQDLFSANRPRERKGTTPAAGAAITFRSGNQQAPADLEGFIKAGQPVGITAQADPKVFARVIAYARKDGQVFVDSGAYGNPTPDFDHILDVYDQLADQIGEDHVANLYVVAPDKAPDANGSYPVETRKLQRDYQHRIDALLDRGVHVIVPIQNSRLFDDDLVEARRTFPKAIFGIPANKGAVDPATTLRAGLTALAGDDLIPAGFHLLGKSEHHGRFADYAGTIRAFFPDAIITADANRARAILGDGRTAQATADQLTEDRSENLIDNEPAGDTTELAGYFFRGQRNAFTVAEVEQLAKALGWTPDELRQNMNGLGFTERVQQTGLEDAVMLELHRIAKARMVKRAQPGARTDAIAKHDKAPASRPATTQPVEGVSITHNLARGSVEIRFKDKPSAQVLDTLKAEGFRRNKGGAWWRKVEVPTGGSARLAGADAVEQARAVFGPKAETPTPLDVPAEDPKVKAAREKREAAIARLKALRGEHDPQAMASHPLDDERDAMRRAFERTREATPTVPKPVDEQLGALERMFASSPLAPEPGRSVRDLLNDYNELVREQATFTPTQRQRMMLLSRTLADRMRELARLPIHERFRLLFPTRPTTDPSEPQRARTEDGKVRTGFGDEGAAARIMASSLYSGDIADVATKELLQNAFDAVRAKGDAGKVELTFGKIDRVPYVQIQDNGAGMTRKEIETVFTDLFDSGKRDQATAAGGFGIAKASFLLGGQKVMLLTVAEVPAPSGLLGRARTVKKRFLLTATPEQLTSKEGVEISEAVVADDTPTGTTVRTYLPANADLYNAKKFAKALSQYSIALPGRFRVIAGVDGAERQADILTDVTPESRTQQFDAWKTVAFEVPGARVAIHLSPDTELRTYANLRVLNNGVYQFDEVVDTTPPGGYTGPSVLLPKNIVADVRSTVAEGDALYPFTANREQLRNVFTTALKRAIYDHVIKSLVEARGDLLQRTYDSLPRVTLTDGTEVPVLDSGRKLTDDEFDTLFADADVKKVVTEIVRITHAILDKALPAAQRHQIERVGILFHENTHGVFIPNPRTNTRDPNDLRATILINPFQHLVSDPTPDAGAAAVYHTAVHEAAHWEVSGHNESFTSHLAALFRQLGAKLEVQSLRRLMEVYGNPSDDTRLVRGVETALRVYQESRRRAVVEEDALSGTGRHADGREDAGGREDGLPRGLDANREGAADNPVDPKQVSAMVDIVRSYLDVDPEIAFPQVARRLQKDYGPRARGLDRYLERVWLLLKKQTVSVADALKGQITVTPLTLGGESAAVQTRAITALEADPEGFKARYLEQFGRVLNADNASELFEDYAKSPEARAQFGIAVRRPAAALVDALYRQLLAETPAEDAIVAFTAGGNASGKSSGIADERSADIIFDSTLSNLATSKANIDKALASGRDVQIRYVWRDPIKALVDGALPRAMNEGHGRTVTVRGLAATYLGARTTVLDLADHYRSDPRVTVKVKQNTEQDVVPRDLAWLQKQAYDDRSELEARLHTALETAHQQGDISDTVYQSTRGTRSDAREDRRGDGRGVSQERREEPGGAQAEVGGPDGDATASERDRPGQPAESGRGTADAVRDGREGVLEPVSAEADAGAAGTESDRPGRSDSTGDASGGLSDRADAGAKPDAARGPDQGTVQSGRVPATGITGDKPTDYALTPERITGILSRGPVQRFRDNVAAIRLVIDLQTEHRYPTVDEQTLLAKYVGWGASELAQYLEASPRHSWSAPEKATWQELREMTTEDQRKALVRSAPNAHFTYDLYQPLWAALARFGFPGGRVLEPAVGTGHAIGFMPADIRSHSTITASELEPITAAIAGYLYPSARVQPVGYEKIRLPRNTQDLAISNVPFGPFGVVDRAFTGDRRFLIDRIHNYFFAKALEHVRPGGYIAFVTSRYTMDGADHTQVRQYLMDRAHFLGAVRLPDTAFKKSAKTEVITDIILLQKRAEGETTSRNAALFIDAPLHEALSTPDTVDWRGRKVPGRNVYRSAWYTAHPELVLGAESNAGEMYADGSYTVTPAEGELGPQIQAALEQLLPAGGYQAATTTSTAPTAKVAEGTFKPGELRRGEQKGTIARVLMDGTIEDSTPRRKDGTVDETKVRRIEGYIDVREARRAVITAMQQDASDAALKKAQGALKRAYDKFVKAFGYLNNTVNRAAFRADPEAAAVPSLETLKVTSKLVTDKNGRESLRVKREVVGLADIFTTRTMNAPAEVTHVDTPHDALLASLGTQTRIDWPYMARITGSPMAALQAALRHDGHVFEQPDGAWVVKDEYLSGDVVSKLADAEAAAEDDPDRYGRNVDALKAVQPKPKTREDVAEGRVVVTLGAHWVAPADIEQFLKDELQLPDVGSISLDGSTQYMRWTTRWRAGAESAGNRHALAVPYGQPVGSVRYGLTDMVSDALNLKSPELGYWVQDHDSRRWVRQEQETLAARANVDELRNLWLKWVYSNPDVLDRMLDIYNTRYNRTVERQYNGEHLANFKAPSGELASPAQGGTRTAALPGLALPFALFKHQLRAVWRILTSGNTLLAHEVGAGKTYEMIVAAMEMRRTGRARKPLITVPTHLLGQWREDILKAYPTAKLLAFDEKDLEAKKRQEAMARIAHGDWDMVLVPHSSFGLLKVSDQRMIDTLEGMIEELRAAEQDAGGRHGTRDDSVKALEAARRRLEDKVNRKLDKIRERSNDQALSWEELGVDALFVDEAHAFKNLYFFSKIDNIRGLSRSESERALDLYIKVQDINRDSNYRNLVLATATPVMNSLAEVYTMQRYLQPQRLRELGFENFDNWYATFADAKNVTEQRPDGSYQEVRRVAKFRNLKLLYQTVADVMDYVSWEDMPYLNLPKIKGQHIDIVQGDKHPLYDTVIQPWFVRRLAQLRLTPPYYNRRTREYHAPDRIHPITGESMHRYDNILTVMNDAKLAAIDARLVLGDHANDFKGSRIQAVARDVAAYYRAEAKKKGIALLFLDVGTPKTITPLEFLKNVDVIDETDGEVTGVEEEAPNPDDEDANALASADFDGDFNLYEALKAALVARGIPSREIAFIHQARNNAERLALFEAARTGTIRVLLASTDKGGVGMNIQDRLGFLADVDAPRAMRPGDMRQRLGRALRQGNSYADLTVKRYVTKGTTDEWLYGLLNKKQGMILDFMRGNVDSYEDDDPSTMSLEEAQIRATGDPRGIELIELKAKLGRLEAQAAAAERAVAQAQGDIVRQADIAATTQKELDGLQAFLAAHPATLHGESFAMQVGDQTFDKRKNANAALIAALKPIAERGLAAAYVTAQYTPVGELAGVPVQARFYRTYDGPQVVVMLDTTAVGLSQTVRATEVGIPTDKTAKTVADSFGEGRNVVASLVDAYHRLIAIPRDLVRDIEDAQERVRRAQQLLDHPPDAVQKAAEARARIAALEAELRVESAAKDQQNQHAVQAENAERARRAHEAELAKQQAETPPSDDDRGGGGAVGADTVGGKKSSFPPEPPQRPHSRAYARIQFPELVELAKALIGIPAVVRKFRKQGRLGEFRAGGLEGGIRLHAGLFKMGHEHELAAVLAHEIGHLIDWLPNKTLTRGNILGRLQTLTKFVKGQYTAADGTTIKNTKVRDELIALSQLWHPWDEEKSPASYTRYRRSSKELYADAISVLLNNPGLLEQQAPIFHQEFFANFDAKPDVRDAYRELQALLSGTPEQLDTRRLANDRQMFEEGDARAIALERQRQREAKEGSKDLWTQLKINLANKHYPFIDRVAALRQQGVTINPDDNPVYYLEERSYMGGKLKAWLQRYIQPAYAALGDAGIDWHTFGLALFYERIIAGDRSEVANPNGRSPEDAARIYQRLRDSLKDDDAREVLDTSISMFREGLALVQEKAYQAGLYSDDLFEQMEQNPAYVSFRVIEHLDKHVTSRVYQQVGTLKGIQNAADATILKVAATIAAIEQQTVKVKAFAFLEQHDAAAIAQAEEVWTGKGYKPIESQDRRQKLVTYYEKGTLRGKYVGEAIADSLTNKSTGQNWAIVRILSGANTGLFRPLFTTLNLGFQSWNVIRDFLRMWKNMPGMTLTQAVRRYWEAVPLARVRAFGLPDKPTAKQITAFSELMEAEETGILGITYNDFSRGREVEDSQIEDILLHSGVGTFKKIHDDKHPIVKGLRAVRDTVAELGDFIETLPKAAAVYEYRGTGAIKDIPMDQRSFIRRKVGSPDFLAGGTLKPFTNNVFLFSNAITQAWMADYEVATDPMTRAAWLWKTAATNVLPKVLQYAALAGAYGLLTGGGDDDELQRLMQRVTEYDLTNYTILPLGEKDGQTVYLRIPQDDTGRFFGAIAWKLLHFGASRKDVWKAVSQTIDYGSGVFPSITPAITGPAQAAVYAAGRNPYDSYRGRNILTDDEQTARDWGTTKKFLGWEFQHLGGSVIVKFYPGETPPDRKTTGQKVIEFLPIVNRFVRITDYGETEHLREPAQAVAQGEARQRRTEDAAINRALRAYQKLPADQQSRYTQRQLAVQLAQELYGNDPTERADRQDNLTRKLRLGVVRGKADRLGDAVMSARSTDQRVALILEGKKTMSAGEFEAWLRTAVQENVISPQVYAAVRKQLVAVR